jgi:Flp pilus assembly protein TadB
MGKVIDDIALFLTTWLALWALFTACYLVLLAALHWSKARWQRYQRERRHRRASAAELARINRAVAASVQRIGLAFMVAQQVMREHDTRIRR